MLFLTALGAGGWQLISGDTGPSRSALLFSQGLQSCLYAEVNPNPEHNSSELQDLLVNH